MRNGSTASLREIVDTNILIYAYDPSDATKQKRSMAIIEGLVFEGRFAVTAQVLNEFYSRATRPGKLPALTHERAVSVIQRVVRTATVLPLTTSETLLALDAVGRYGISFWDALIWGTAKAHGISTIHTEDVPGAPEIDGVRYHNPFSAAP
jgi:predicted nucleic acid-binding protein